MAWSKTFVNLNISTLKEHKTFIWYFIFQTVTENDSIADETQL